MSKITVLVGSPRKDGNTEMLADAFIKGATAAGNEVAKIHLRERKVNGATYGDESSTEADMAIAHYKTIISRGLGLKDLGIVTANGVMDRGSIAGHKSLAQAEELGKGIE